MKVNTVLRHVTRYLIFNTPLLRDLVAKLMKPVRTPAENATYWDRQLKETTWNSYLGNTSPVDMRNSIIAVLIKHQGPENPDILDVACAGGTLSKYLNFQSYTGFDVSQYATKLAAENTKLENTIFKTVDLRSYNISNSKFDVIVFSETLYYLSVRDAVGELLRYSSALRDNGIFIVSMKNDGKSYAIYQGIEKEFTWLDAMIVQEKPNGPDYSIKINRECPAYLIAAIKPHSTD